MHTSVLVNPPHPTTSASLVSGPGAGPTLAVEGVESLSVSGVRATDQPVLDHQVMVTDANRNEMMGLDTPAGKPTITEDLRPSQVDERPDSRWIRKNEYSPPSGYVLRNVVIFCPRVQCQLHGTNAGERLESILEAELCRTPGFNIGHADGLYGFAMTI